MRSDVSEKETHSLIFSDKTTLRLLPVMTGQSPSTTTVFVFGTGTIEAKKNALGTVRGSGPHSPQRRLS
jgi:hypothetical protein